ncbi:glycosyltransferase family 4 protein [Enterovibrio norvegicus]|uniref:glycosyltransferase family 4 protein n=1 Tax=Enterovibrio norvegicus TaxID=188144 RepID=UPI00354CAF32
MRIALFPDEYLPEGTRVHAKMFNELAVELQAQGHKAIVVTPGTQEQPDKLEVDFVNGVEVWRFKCGTLRGVGKIKRAINESLLSYRAWEAIKPKLDEQPIDLCINYSPTIFFGPLMKKIKKEQGSFVYLILRDMFPQWAIDEGMISANGPVARYFRFFEKLNYNASDCVGLMSQANIDYFSSLHPEIKNIEVLRNWSDMKCHETPCSLINVREKYSLGNKVIFFYGGNIGHAQDMNNLLRLVKSMKEYPNAHFLFVGQGDEFKLVLSRKEEWALDNLTVTSSVDQSTFMDILTQVDVGLFSLAKSHKAHNFPGKLLGYKANKLPILGSLNPRNDLERYINGNECGFAFVNGEDDALFNAAKSLLSNSVLRRQLGKNGQIVLRDNFSVEATANAVVRICKK